MAAADNQAHADQSNRLPISQDAQSDAPEKQEASGLPDDVSSSQVTGQNGRVQEELIPNASSSSPSVSRTNSTLPEASQSQNTPVVGNQTTTGGVKEKKKAVSFLTRFLNTNKKRTSTFPNPSDRTSIDNDRSTLSSSRPDDMDSSMLKQDIDNIEFSPRVLQPTGYVKVRSKNKQEREFDKLFLAQELKVDNSNGSVNGAQTKGPKEKGEPPDQNAIWATAFSRDGKYLAVGGQNRLVTVWSVLGSVDEREAQDAEDEGQNPTQGRIQLRASVFRSTPVRTFTDHEGPVNDLSWSKNNFLLTTSQDRTVRLYHPSRSECLCTFKHAMPVHAIAFHPNDDRFFLAGSKDSKLRLWSIPDKRVEFWANVGDMITAVAFSPDGKTAMAGTVGASISIYTTEGLKFSSSFQVRSKKKSRITGLETSLVHGSPDAVKILVTCADSRVLLYNFRDKGLELKLKGHKNDELTMKASINDDGRYVICGSEDKSIYIWSLTDTNELPAPDKNKDKTIQRPMEFFEANTAKTTCAIMAPRETRVILNASGCPIYDICNPPPVRLVEREGSIASSKLNDSKASSINIAPRTPIHAKTFPLSPATDDTTTPKTTSFSDDLFKTNPSYHARATHPDGHILITTSITGLIRVYRQDCAVTKRQRVLDANDPLSNRRSLLRKAFPTPSSRSSLSNGVPPARSGSIRSFKNPATPSVRSLAINGNGENRLSMSLGGAGELVARSRRAESGASGASSQVPARDRIERWREDTWAGEGVDRTNSVASLRRADSAASAATSGSLGTSAFQSVLGANESPIRSGSGKPSITLDGGSATSTTDDGTENGLEMARRTSSIANPLRLQGGQSFMFWNVSQYGPKKETSLLRPDARQRPSEATVASRLTSEESSHEESMEEEPKEDEDISPAMMRKCPRCGGMEFSVKESRSWTLGKVKSVVCEGCGLERKDSL
ncbi:WD40 repeat-like protein [Microthyrium microscopicum]|uniref:WD40 repeat-like protein n=1 Tax=Microthyrium microscopicum TaxID=703497 RepID=A0A6A6U6U4_9PEZI|nr:WD40 repeat-like protein [Microthyrium microscopicum]